MKPKTAFLLFLAMFAPGTFAAPRQAASNVTVDQLDQLLASVRNESDAKEARELAGLRLTERASAARLAQWQAELAGSRAREALIALVDASEFLRSPADEIVPAPQGAPGGPEILARAVEFAKTTLPKLPNFYALRSTTSFEVASEAQLRSEELEPGLLQSREVKQPALRALGPAGVNGTPDQKLYWSGSFTQTVTYRDGAEVREPATGGAERQNPGLVSLTTWGEFGPILRMVLEDAPADKTFLDHWEKGTSGPLAVLRYSVPRARSHVGLQLSGESPIEYPAYEGEIAVDPASGTIFRIAIRTEASGRGYIAESFTAVEFGPTEIAGVNYICPVRGVAIAKYLDAFANENAQPPPLPFRTSINDVTFTNYHVFRTTAHIVTGLSGR